MKRSILFFCVILISFFSKAQELPVKQKNTLDISYYSTDIGSNIAAEYNKNIKRHTFIVGIKCHLNYYIKPDGNFYHHHFFAAEFSEFIGATLGYKYHLKDINPYVSPYLLFNSQIARMHTKYRTMPDMNLANGYNHSETAIGGPYTAIESTIGAGLLIKLTEKISLNQSGGVGTAFFIQNPKPIYDRGWNWEMMIQWRVGLSFTL